MAERRTRRTGLSRLQPLVPLALVWSAGFVVLLAVALQRQVPYDELLLDPNNLAGVPWYTGLVSNLGILGWTTATATGYFGGWIAHHGGRRAASRMLLEGALLSTVLLFDDLLQLHVLVRPLLGLPKATAYLAYLALAAHWTINQRLELRRTRYELLLASGAAFALSIGFDQVADRIPGLGADHGLLIEDAAKFLGVLAWAEFFVITSGAIVISIVAELRERAIEPRERAIEPRERVSEPRERAILQAAGPVEASSSSSSA